MKLERLKELRIENNLTQTDVANHLHIRQNTYSQYETGVRELPIQTLIDLAKLYDVSTDYILTLSDK